MTTVNPSFAGKAAETSISVLFGTPKTEAASAIAAIVARSPTVSAAPPTASNAASGKITAALMVRPTSSGSEQAALPPINETASTPAELAMAEANAFMAQAVPDLFNRPLEPVKFSSGESAIAMGWSYIGDLQSTISSINTASALDSTEEIAFVKSQFGDDIAARVQEMDKRYLSDSRKYLDDQLSRIGSIFTVSGKLVDTDESGKLSMGRFTLTFDNGNFRASVGTDQHAWVVQKGAVREVSVHQVLADLVAGKLML